MDNLQNVESQQQYDEFITEEVDEVLYRGNFSKVIRAFHKTTSTDIAVKKIDLSLAEEQLGEDGLREQFEEVELIQQFDHYAVLPFYGSFNNTAKNELIVFTAYCPNSLHTVIENVRKQRQTLSDAQLICYIAQLADGLSYIHLHNMIHGNLRTSVNISPNTLIHLFIFFVSFNNPT